MAKRRIPFKANIPASTISRRGLKRVPDTRIRHVDASAPGQAVKVIDHKHTSPPGTKHVRRVTTRLRKTK